MGSEIVDDIPERPLVTERLAALDSNGNDCKLARYVLYLEGEVGRLEKENSSMQKVQYEALALLNEKDADLMAALAEIERLSAENAELKGRRQP